MIKLNYKDNINDKHICMNEEFNIMLEKYINETQTQNEVKNTLFLKILKQKLLPYLINNKIINFQAQKLQYIDILMDKFIN